MREGVSGITSPPKGLTSDVLLHTRGWMGLVDIDIFLVNRVASIAESQSLRISIRLLWDVFVDGEFLTKNSGKLKVIFNNTIYIGWL